MSIPRIYQSTPLLLNATVQLDEKSSHHLAKVLRVQLNDKIILFNGEGGEWEGIVIDIGKKITQVRLDSFSEREAESSIRIHLVQGLVSNEKMDFIIQKAVELGVNCITPLITQRCNVKLSQEREEKRMKHWQAVMISACEQSGRTRLPIIHPPLTFKKWLPTVNSRFSFVLTPHLKGTLPKVIPKDEAVLVLIGPEGGLSAEEIEATLAHDFLSLHLGPRILRTETAPLTALSILQFQFGDLS